jgi:hypothetical protein
MTRMNADLKPVYCGVIPSEARDLGATRPEILRLAAQDDTRLDPRSSA